MLKNFNKLYQKFKNKFSQIKISFSKLLFMNEMVSYQTLQDLTVSVCTYHQNASSSRDQMD